MKAITARLIYAGWLALLCATAVAQDSLPNVGPRIRVVAPKLGQGWHVGLLSQLRVTPICMVVLVFDAPPGNKMTQLKLSEITRMQQSTRRGGDGSGNHGTVSYPGENWLDVSLPDLWTKNHCQVKWQ